jgi:hypothetical protein
VGADGNASVCAAERRMESCMRWIRISLAVYHNSAGETLERRLQLTSDRALTFQ